VLEGTSLRDDVAKAQWYHSIDLPGGVRTPGLYDLTPALSRSLLPASLKGKRCLDIGTHDGFWAFEMERRGAAEVVAIDLDDPEQFDFRHPVPPMDLIRADIARRKHAFETARAALDSHVQRESLSVYDFNTAHIGSFDFAFMGTLLHHLRDPVGALSSVRRVVTGELVLNGVFSFSKSLMYPRTPVAELLPTALPAFWNVPNLVALRHQVTAAGWDIARSGRPYMQRYGAGWKRPALELRPRGWSTLFQSVVLQFGVPHLPLCAVPAS
jgi:tRNA (mo5U34)-methyltransferase